jgi:hypothetical protein
MSKGKLEVSDMVMAPGETIGEIVKIEQNGSHQTIYMLVHSSNIYEKGSSIALDSSVVFPAFEGNSRGKVLVMLEKLTDRAIHAEDADMLLELGKLARTLNNAAEELQGEMRSYMLRCLAQLKQLRTAINETAAETADQHLVHHVERMNYIIDELDLCIRGKQ